MLQTPPTPPECFGIDRNYAYGIALHTVVDVVNLDAAAIEQSIIPMHNTDLKTGTVSGIKKQLGLK